MYDSLISPLRRQSWEIFGQTQPALWAKVTFCLELEVEWHGWSWVVFPCQLFSTVSLSSWFLLAFLHGSYHTIDWKAVSCKLLLFIGDRLNIGRVMDLYRSLPHYWRSSLKKCDRWVLSRDRRKVCVRVQTEDLFRLTLQQIHSPLCLNLTVSDRNRRSEFVPASVFELEHHNILVRFSHRLDWNIGEISCGTQWTLRKCLKLAFFLFQGIR